MVTPKSVAASPLRSTVQLQTLIHSELLCRLSRQRLDQPMAPQNACRAHLIMPTLPLSWFRPLPSLCSQRRVHLEFELEMQFWTPCSRRSLVQQPMQLTT